MSELLTRSSGAVGETRPSALAPLDAPGRGGLKRFWRDMDWYRFLAASFAVCVAAPTLATAVYFGAIAAPIYAADARIAIRAPLAPAEDILDAADPEDEPDDDQAGSTVRGGTFGGDRDGMPGAAAAARAAVVDAVGRFLRAGSDGKDPYIVASFLRSRAIVEALNRDGWLKSVFSRPEADWLARLDPDATDEELWEYLQGRISADVDTISGIVRVSARAFTAADAKTLADRLVAEAERMANDLRGRSRRDALARAEADLRRAEWRFVSATAEVAALRDRVGVVDPRDEIRELFKRLIELKAARAALETARREAAAIGGPDSPALADLARRVAALDAEIDAMESRIAGGARDGTAATALVAEFENRETDRLLAEAQYQQAELAFRRARAEAERQAVFLAVYDPPALPERPDGPRGLAAVLTVLLTCFAGWSVATLIGAAARDRLT